jgi:alkylation response protein AidB-like acyl-CoA dehydrogenase
VRLRYGEAEEQFRRDLIAWLDEHAPAPEVMNERKQSSADLPEWARRWQRTLFEDGWLVPGWPPELGGRDATPAEQMIYFEELSKRDIHRSLNPQGLGIVAPSIKDYGTPEQQERFLLPTLRAEISWCLGMSEPGAGSDLASLSTRAVLDGDHFVVNGQKVWTSYAMAAQKCFCYVRTDPSAPKHKGISLLIMDMDTPGIDIRPLRHISGAANFAEVFFSDVVVPRENLVGSLNDGWRITQGSLAHERAGLWVEGVSRLETTIHGLVELATRRGLIDDPIVRRRLAELSERAASLRALGYKGFSSFAQGSSAPEHSFMKMATSELGKEVWEYGMELQGAYGAVADPDRGEEDGRWVMGFFMSFANTIAGGSSEIQRNIIAHRVLGLPRAR